MKDSDGTIVFSYGKIQSEAAEAMEMAKTMKKPWIHIDLQTEKNPSLKVRTWLAETDIKILNVAGRSASKLPGLKKSINDIISMVLNR